MGDDDEGEGGAALADRAGTFDQTFSYLTATTAAVVYGIYIQPIISKTINFDVMWKIKEKVGALIYPNTKHDEVLETIGLQHDHGTDENNLDENVAVELDMKL